MGLREEVVESDPGLSLQLLHRNLVNTILEIIRSAIFNNMCHFLSYWARPITNINELMNFFVREAMIEYDGIFIRR